MNATLAMRRLIRLCKRSINIEAKYQDKWIKPEGSQTEISIYNPITKCKVPLILKTENTLKWYICGPTVYDSAHIGHATTYIKSDIIRRILSDYFDINVLFVMGITDIDDKIIKRSIESKKDFSTLSRYFESEFFADMNKLNVREPYLCCRVTDYIPQIIQFIEKLVAKDDGYVTEDGSVYFNTKKYKRYGKLLNPPDLAKDEPVANKRSSMDFALWKVAKENEPFWKSPWGFGRPGWHIECSAIASTVFGNSVDIHSGGIDLIFPHHENEEAQSCCYHNVGQWVNYWLHCGHLTLKEIKMSKSLKNTISIQEYLESYSANDLRMLCLLSHYRNGIDFTSETMQTATSITNKIDNFIKDCNNYVAGRFKAGEIDENLLLTTLHDTRKQVYSALADDFDTSKAMHAIINLVGMGNRMLRPDNLQTSQTNNITAIAAVSNYLSNILSKFGISQSAMLTTKNRQVDDIIDHFLKFRTVVRVRALDQNPKDTTLLKECDNARKCLATCGIIVKDQQDVTSWSWK